MILRIIENISFDFLRIFLRRCPVFLQDFVSPKMYLSLDASVYSLLLYSSSQTALQYPHFSDVSPCVSVDRGISVQELCHVDTSAVVLSLETTSGER